MSHVRKPDDGYDTTAAKRHVNVTLNEDLVRIAQTYTDNLSGTIETLLADWARAEREKKEKDREHWEKVAASWSAFDEKHGSFAHEWSQHFWPDPAETGREDRER